MWLTAPEENDPLQACQNYVIKIFQWQVKYLGISQNFYSAENSRCLLV